MSDLDQRGAGLSGGGLKKALFGVIFLALLVVGADAVHYYRPGAGIDVGIISALRGDERYPVGRLAPVSKKTAAVAPKLTAQAAVGGGGGELARRAIQTCAEMRAAIAAVTDKERGVMRKTMNDIAKRAEQLPIGLERVARSKSQSQEHYKKMLLRYFGRNCAAIAELFRGEREIGR